MLGSRRKTISGVGIDPWKLALFISTILVAYGLAAGEMEKIYDNAMIICTSCIGLS